MAPFYFADSIGQPSRDTPSSDQVNTGFKLTYHTALAAAGAPAGFLINDYLVLAPLPTSGFALDEYWIDMPSTDGATTVTWDLGDNQVLAGAVTGKVSTASFTTPALPQTPFTLTASASTASFTATNGLLMVGGVMISYAALSGSTFTTCYAAVQNFTVPGGAIIQQAGNTAAYNAVAVVSQNAESFLSSQFGNITGTTATAATLVSAALPAMIASSYSTGFGVSPAIATPYNLGPLFFMLKCHASPASNPTYTTAAIKGWHRGHYIGF